MVRITYDELAEQALDIVLDRYRKAEQRRENGRDSLRRRGLSGKKARKLWKNPLRKGKVITFSLLLFLLSGCSLALRPSSNDELEVKVKSLSEILKENDVQSCIWLSGQAGTFFNGVVVLAGRVDIKDCLEARHP